MRIEPILRDNLLLLARAYAQARDVKMVTISTLAYGEAPFFDMLIEQERLESEAPDAERVGRKGSFTVRKYDEVVAWFDTNWPPGIEKPKLRPAGDVQGRRSGSMRGRTRQREDAAAG